ncbi:MAG TPA: hypothetical protein VID27_19845 [Blastocatellia bacterium]|jgi:hypothetical protein
MIKQIFVTVLATITFLTSSGNAFAQKKERRNLIKRPKDSLTPANIAPYMKTKRYQQSHEILEQDFWRLHEPEEQEEILSQKKEIVLSIVTSDKDFQKLFRARYWCAKNAVDIIPDLIELIKNPKTVGLENEADTIIWERIASGDLKFYGHGAVVPDDIFSVAGRASWILKEITAQNFGSVSMKSTSEELNRLSEAWAKWYEKNK